MQNKSMLDFDSIVKICMDFYSSGEVVAARQLIEQHSSSSGNRLARRQGGNMVCSMLEGPFKLDGLPTSKTTYFLFSVRYNQRNWSQ